MLILIRGLPGSGKSTLAKQLTRARELLHLEADMYFTDENDENYQFDASKLGAAHLWCQKQTLKNLKQGNSVVVSNTFTQVWEIRPYQRMAQQCSVELYIYECEGQFANVHNVPLDKIEAMCKRWDVLPRDLKKRLKSIEY
ncbi:ATP-binding protein [Vibrio breoganii]|uniref:ATP-binding protein n=1 Tax=Vibrio breoganii TaxID=553239 RepID=A0ABX1U9Z8_9VIBR|nr:ATP-binding protein [Vibrio breoganii]NMO73476.1 ATP-binding protein [Vibrio breoganii]NMR70099.1 ATP-binding protein [Vibrio breoganii]PML89216.1 AAA family ATPase [Vibrio breoganii]